MDVNQITGSGGSRKRAAPPPPQQPLIQYVSEPATTTSENGGATTYVPRVEGNNLFSKSTTKLILAVSEGECGGLTDGMKSIYFDGVPLQNADGSYNFQGVSVTERLGTMDQDPPQGFEETATQVDVGPVTLRSDTWVTKTITNPQVDAVTLLLTVPELITYAANRDELGASVSIEIAIQYNGGGFRNIRYDTISGITRQPYQRQYRIFLNGAFPVDIRVIRRTPEAVGTQPDGSVIRNAIAWSSYAEITYAKLAYPGTAYVGLQIDSEFTSTLQQVSVDWKGIKIRVPNNATVDSATGRLIYSGVWTGTLGPRVWCSCPVWHLWDLLTSKKHGCGRRITDDMLPRYDFYAASVYGSQLVSDGRGGLEPRFSCNGVMQTADSAHAAIRDLCNAFRGNPYVSTGGIAISQDRPQDPVMEFGNTTAIDGEFSYAGSALDTRPTVVTASYFNMQTRALDYATYQDLDGLRRYGAQSTQTTVPWCTSEATAMRAAKWLYGTESRNSGSTSFTTTLNAYGTLRPGLTFTTMDDLRSGPRRQGRIAAATTSALTLDDASGLYGGNLSISVMLSSGALQTRPVASVSGNVATMATAFSEAPAVNGLWVAESPTLRTQLWSAARVEERQPGQYAITGVAYDPSKFAWVDSNMALEPRDITDLDLVPGPVGGLIAKEIVYDAGTRSRSKINISWGLVLGSSQYRFSWRYGQGAWSVATVARNSSEIEDSTSGEYTFTVAALSAGLYPGPVSSLTFPAYGKTAPPSDPTGLSLVPIDEATAILSWDQAPDVDVRIGGFVEIRHSPLTAGAVWEDSIELARPVPGGQTQARVPLLTGTISIKLVDDTGNKSVFANSVVVTLPAPQSRLLIYSYAEESESPPFSGTYQDMVYSSSLEAAGGGAGITIAAGLPWDSDEMMDSDELVDGDPGEPVVVLPSGEYGFGSTYALPGVFDVNLRRRLLSVSYSRDDFWDSDEMMDSADSADGERSDVTNVRTLVRTTLDDPSGSPSWGDWAEFANSITRARGLQFKIEASTGDPTQNLLIQELGAELELQQRIEQSAVLTSGTTTYAATFAAAFIQPPSVGITAYNMATGDYFTITAVTRQGFNVTFRDSAAAAVSRSFAFTAVGYGREV